MKKRPLPPNTILHSKHAEFVFRGERFDVFRWKQKQFDGSEKMYESARRIDTVTVIPVIGEEIILVEEEQPHWGCKGLTLISGGVAHDEDLQKAARRELKEETGMEFKDFYLVSVEKPVSLEWFVYTFIAKNLAKTGKKELEAGERNEVLRISFKELVRLTREEKFYYRPGLVERLLMKGGEELLYSVLKDPQKHILPNS